MKNPTYRHARVKPIRVMGLMEGVKTLHARFKANNWWLDADSAVTLAKRAGAGKRSAPAVGKRGAK